MSQRALRLKRDHVPLPGKSKVKGILLLRAISSWDYPELANNSRVIGLEQPSSAMRRSPSGPSTGGRNVRARLDDGCGAAGGELGRDILGRCRPDRRQW